MEALWKSCYDFRWIASQRESGIWAGIGWFVLVCALLASVRAHVMAPEISKFVDKTAKIVENELPSVTIKDGKVTVEGQQPWRKEFGKEFAIIVDTTGQTREVGSGFQAGILLTDKSLVLKTRSGETQNYNLSKVKDFSSRGPQTKQFIAGVRKWSFPVATATLTALTIFGAVLRWLLGVMAVWIAALALNVRLSWGKAAVMGIYPLIPAAYLISLRVLGVLPVPILPTIAQFILLFAALKIVKSEEQAPAVPSPGGFDGGITRGP